MTEQQPTAGPYFGITGADLAAHIRTGTSPALEAVAARAVAELDRVLGPAVTVLEGSGALGPVASFENAYRPMPYVVWRELALEVGAELWNRRAAPSGGGQYADMATGQPVKAPRDPLATVWPTIYQYIPRL